MNIQQLQYILALEKYRHFETAADKCFVTQSTLSTMINRYEEEIGIKIFNRKTKPASITKEGLEIIDRIKIVTKELDFLEDLIQNLKGEMTGELNIGIIPTIAPYLLPLFLKKFANEFPKVKMIVQEMTTSTIQTSLKNRSIDIGILAIPVYEKELEALELYTEPFLIYDCTTNKPTKSKLATFEALDFSQLWLLQEGHCLRTQVQQICDLSKKALDKKINFEFKAGSLDSLIRFTKANDGITILPYLAAQELKAKEKENLITFEHPIPVRTIGLLTHKHFVKKKLFSSMQEIIIESIAPLIPKTEKYTSIDPL